MKESLPHAHDRIQKPKRIQKNPDRNLPDFLIRQQLLNHCFSTAWRENVVIPTIKLKILKANHNLRSVAREGTCVVIPTIKLKILKANHNALKRSFGKITVVIPTIKLKILKANHNSSLASGKNSTVVIPTIKLKILKANHNLKEKQAATEVLLSQP